MSSVQENEIKQNFDFFQTVIETLLPEHQGKFALLRDRAIVELFPTPIDAMSDGHKRFEDGVFSVQRVIDRPLDLGFLSYGENNRVVA